MQTNIQVLVGESNRTTTSSPSHELMRSSSTRRTYSVARDAVSPTVVQSTLIVQK